MKAIKIALIIFTFNSWSCEQPSLVLDQDITDLAPKACWEEFSQDEKCLCANRNKVLIGPEKNELNKIGQVIKQENINTINQAIKLELLDIINDFVTLESGYELNSEALTSCSLANLNEITCPSGSIKENVFENGLGNFIESAKCELLAQYNIDCNGAERLQSNDQSN